MKNIKKYGNIKQYGNIKKHGRKYLNGIYSIQNYYHYLKTY